jgi:hypothetical protein
VLGKKTVYLFGCTVTGVQSVVPVVTFLVKDLMTVLSWRTRDGQVSLHTRIPSKLWTGFPNWANKYRSACSVAESVMRCGLFVSTSFSQSSSTQYIITILFEEFPAVHLCVVLSMQSTLRYYTDNISQALANFCSSFSSLTLWSLKFM